MLFCTFLIFYNKWVASNKQEEGKVLPCYLNSDSECLDSEFGEEKIYFISEFQ